MLSSRRLPGLLRPIIVFLLYMCAWATFPPAYARQGGEVLAAQLAKIGITAKIENLEWAQWLSGVFNATGPQNYDLTIVSTSNRSIS